jgi:hypothetical protein
LSAMSFTDQSAIGLGSSLGSEGMAGTYLSRPGTFSSQSSGESALPSESSSPTTYFLNKPWSDTSRLSYGTSLDAQIADQSVMPQHFQSFLQWIPNHQDPREAYQYQHPSFSTG